MSSEARYRTAPVASKGMPPGIPYIVANEAAERYSFYGMRAILVIFMTKYLMNAQGELDPMTNEQATAWFHMFVWAVYSFPILGAILSDAFLGKYRTIMALSIVYCLGHLTLAIDDSRVGLGLGLALIAMGSGGIKPCVSAHVGDQFGPSNAYVLTKVLLRDQRGRARVDLVCGASPSPVRTVGRIRSPGCADGAGDIRLLEWTQQVCAHPSWGARVRSRSVQCGRS